MLLRWFIWCALATTSAALPDARAQVQDRSGETQRADADPRFEARLAQNPRDADALVGAGFVALHDGNIETAARFFRRAIEAAPRYADAMYGLGLCLMRRGQLADAQRTLQAAHDLAPEREDIATSLATLPVPLEPLAPRARPDLASLTARVRGRVIEVVDEHGEWRPFFIKGINLGAALPGKFPSQFPDKQTYAQWLREMAELGVNTLRVYTIHPPEFYEALLEHNNSAAKPLYLIHGVWTELPPNDDFREPAWWGSWSDEIRHVVDLIHGHANLEPRPGHASGAYRADVSRWVLAYILGREWEPDSVLAFNKRHPGEADWAGRFVSVRRGHASEVFMAEALELLIGYEHDSYNAQRPAAFTSWPTLDPLSHPTEATKAEELALRQRLKLPVESKAELREYDNDAVALDMEKFDAAPQFAGGLFASYHAYPYYPDFIGLDPTYSQGQDHQGRSNYSAYLADLVRHHTRHPVVIAEFGVPSSRLIAHWQPQGLTHGGQNEREQGEQNARLFRNIHDTGCAGGILFAWIDEWFKHNWLVIEYELPPERKPLWYNAMDAEENYGLIAFHPGDPGPAILIDGASNDWTDRPFYASSPGLSLKLFADEGWLHLALYFDGAAVDWSREGFLIGLDTIDARLGDHQLPFGLPLRSTAGLEFVVKFQGGTATVLVDDPYDLFTHRYARPVRSAQNDDGRFVMPMTESNRRRIGRDGTVYPERRQEIGWLTRGTQDRSAAEFDSRAEWQAGPGFIEARIPWGLLNVTDPSSHQVVQDRERTASGEIGTATTEGFRAVAVHFDLDGDAHATIRETLPDVVGGRLALPPLFTWSGWELPRYHRVRKLSFGILQSALSALPETPLTPAP